jgi:hypothetical protein
MLFAVRYTILVEIVKGSARNMRIEKPEARKTLPKSEKLVTSLDKTFFAQVLFGIPYDAAFTVYGMHLTNDASAFFKAEESARSEKELSYSKAYDRERRRSEMDPKRWLSLVHSVMNEHNASSRRGE